MLAYYNKLTAEPVYVGDVIEVEYSLLTKNSSKIFGVICPMCGKEWTVPKYSLEQKGHSYCQPCKQRLGAYGSLIGAKIGRITITGFAPPANSKSGGDRTVLLASCDCGNQTTVYAQSARRSLRKGSIFSCGCYTAERTRNMGLGNAGPNNPMYRHDLTEQEKRKKTKKRQIPGQLTYKKKVRARDGACIVCGSTTDLEVHHMFDWARNESLWRSMGNGVTLCNQHHKEFHYSYLRNSHKPCTPQDFYVYLATIHQWSGQQIEKLIEEKQLSRDDTTIAGSM